MERLDILDRAAFVEQLLQIVEYIADNRSSTCFALNGSWGCGKTFVLDMFQEKLEQIQSSKTFRDKYFVIRYNSWLYDYYEEPLVAIVASMLSMIEEKTSLIPDSEKKREILGVLKAVGVTLLSIGNATLQSKTGLDVQKVFETIHDGKEEGTSDYKDEHAYDVYFSLNKVMRKLFELLKSISEDYTVVFLVDELDRCLPEYAIKVLERLHHLTENQSNIITIISIDKKQLISSVKQIFGFENPEKYLEKFISFEVKLDCGTVRESAMQKYSDYFALFDRTIFPFEDSVEEYLSAVFKDVDVRTQEQLIQKSMLAHKLLYSEGKDYTFMCMEILLAVMICVYKDNSCFNEEPIDLDGSYDNVFVTSRKSRKPAFADFFKEEFKKIRMSHDRGFPGDQEIYILPDEENLYGAILYTWYWMHPKSGYSIVEYRSKGKYESISKNYEELKKFSNMLKMIS